jgi:F0F1-type ATP synthase membrane subunit b/b'
MTPIEKFLRKSWDWYKGLPWYWKVLGAVLLLAILVLAILAVVAKLLAPGPRTDADPEHATTVDTALDGQEEIRKELDETIKLKKKELYKAVNAAETIDANTLKRRKEIEAAASMDELDELQRKMGL